MIRERELGIRATPAKTEAPVKEAKAKAAPKKSEAAEAEVTETAEEAQ